MSSEDLKSLIVTDPSLVDEGIDVSGLRTQTDTNPRLLASIADYPGISYDPTSFSYLSDLNELFGYGLPLAEEGKVLPPATGTPGTGGGGGGSGSGSQVTVPRGVNTLVIGSCDVSPSILCVCSVSSPVSSFMFKNSCEDSIVSCRPFFI